jgi:signal transduction histidine kinase
MEQRQLDLLLRSHDYNSADTLRIKVCFLLLIFCIAGTLLFIASYIATQQYSLIPYILLPFGIPCAVFYYLLREHRSYRISLILIAYIYTMLGLMHLSSAPDYLVDLFLLPVFIGSAFLTLKYQHAILMIFYLLFLYVATSAIVIYYQPFDILYTNGNTSSIAVGFMLSIGFSIAMYYFFAKNYQHSSRLLSNTILTLSKTNDDNKLLLGVLSHDFRNYLVRVLLHVEESKALCTQEQQLQGMENIEVSIYQLSNLLTEAQQVRDLFQDENTDALAETAFSEIMKKLELVFRLQMQKKGLEFDIQSDAGAKLRVNRDVFIHIILANLIGNAIKFSPPKAKISLHMQVDANGKCLTISNLSPVTQLGNLQKIARGDEKLVSLPGTQDEQGQGLGVSITKRFCRSYNIAHMLSIEPTDDAGLLRVNTTLKFS